jgi:SAM-dependent methyltransferase
MIPDWQLPPGVDRGLHDYMRSGDMVAGYDAMMAASPLAAFDVRFCARWFDKPGSLIDLGCGTGRLAKAFVPRGFGYVGVDLSDEMLRVAQDTLTPQPPLPSPGEGEKDSHTLPPLSSAAEQRVGEGPGVRAVFVRVNLVELTAHVSGPFDYAACLFSTLGMVRGHENRLKVLRNAVAVLKPGGRLVLHVHNRYFRGLGLKGWRSGDVTMPQAYGGAPLTLHHFGRGEAVRMLSDAGFRVLEVLPVGIDGALPRPWLLSTLRAYGYLIAAELTPRPAAA